MLTALVRKKILCGENNPNSIANMSRKLVMAFNNGRQGFETTLHVPIIDKKIDRSPVAIPTIKATNVYLREILIFQLVLDNIESVLELIDNSIL